MKSARFVFATLIVLGVSAASMRSSSAQVPVGVAVDVGNFAVGNVDGAALVAEFQNEVLDVRAAVTNGDALSRAQAFAAYRARRRARAERARELRRQRAFRRGTDYSYNPGFHVPVFHGNLLTDPFSGLVTGGPRSLSDLLR